MEFKGTKGKWKVETLDDTFIENENNEAVLCIQHNGCYKNVQQNALLISKAPEMLEMLKECYKYLPYEGVMRKKVEQLIKQATEL